MATQLFKDGKTRFVEANVLQGFLDDGWSVEGEVPTAKNPDVVVDSNFSIGDVATGDPAESDSARLMRFNTERNIEAGSKLGEVDLSGENLKKVMEESAKIFDDVRQRDLKFYEEARQYVVERYVPDPDTRGAAIKHALNRIESLYIKKEPYTTAQVEAIDVINESEKDEHVEVTDEKPRKHGKKRARA